MTTTPDVPVPDDERPDATPPEPDGAPGAEIGMSEEPNTFEPEEGQEPTT